MDVKSHLWIKEYNRSAYVHEYVNRTALTFLIKSRNKVKVKTNDDVDGGWMEIEC